VVVTVVGTELTGGPPLARVVGAFPWPAALEQPARHANAATSIAVHRVRILLLLSIAYRNNKRRGTIV
jgi:hypothetical protein